MAFHTSPAIYPGAVHLNVSDLEKSIAFYTEIIGFTILEQTEKEVVFSSVDKVPLLVLHQPENLLPKENRRTGLYHFALLLPSRADLGRILVHFAEKNVRLAAADHLVSEALYLSDPDDNGIEIYIDRDPAIWEWENDLVRMTTDPLDFQDIVDTSGDKKWEGLPAGTVMGHVHLHVANLRETERFYQALGFEVVSKIPMALFMSNAKYHHHVGLNTWNGEDAPAPSTNSVGLKHVTFIYPSESVLFGTIERLKEYGSEVSAIGETFEVVDPSGIHLILRN